MSSDLTRDAAVPRNLQASVGDWVRAHRWALAVGALTVLAFALRVGGLDQSFYGDEGYTIDDVVDRRLIESLSRVREYEDTPPFFFLVAWFAAKVGDPLTWVRVPALVAGTAAIPLGYLLGARTVGRSAGLIGAGLLALSPFAVHFSTEARAYSLLVLLLLASTYALVRVLEEPGRRIWWIAFWLATVLSLYTHYTGFFVVAAQAAWALGFHRPEWKRLLTAYVLVLAAVAPWMLTRPDSHAAAFEALYPFTLDWSLKYWAQSLVGTPQIGIETEPGRVGWWLLAAAAVICVIGLVLARPRRVSAPRGLLLLVATAFAAPVGIVLYSLLSTSVIAGRNMFASAPFMCLLVGALLARLRRPLMVAATALVAAALVTGLVIAAKPRWERPAWKEVASYLEAHAAPGEPIVIGSQFGAPGVGDRELFLQTLSVYMDQANLIGIAVDDREGFHDLEPSRRLWVAVQSVIGHRRPTPPALGRGYKLVSQRSYWGFAPVGLFRYSRDPVGPWDRSRLIRRDGRELLVRPGEEPRPLTQGDGFLEGIAAQLIRLRVAGWAVDEKTGRPPRQLLLFYKGRFLGSARPTVERPDIEKQFPGALRSGFGLEVSTGRAEQLAVPEQLTIVAVSGKRAWRLPQLPNLVVGH